MAKVFSPGKEKPSMENKLINYNRRGMICAINKTCQEQNLQ